MYRTTVLVLLAALSIQAQAPVANGDFEKDQPGVVPSGWFSSRKAPEAEFTATIVDQGCRSGARCALIKGIEPPAKAFSNLSQSVPATGYHGRRVRLRAAIRVEGEATRAQMWLRIDRADKTVAFFENMAASPIVSPAWSIYDIEANVAADANHLVFGVMVFGPGKAWVDDVALADIGVVVQEPAEAPRPLTARGLTNLTAFTRLYGYVRFFHPSDQAARTDWETFAAAGVRKVEAAASDAELIDRLREVFGPVAPTVQVFPTGRRPAPAAQTPTARIARYQHKGVGLASGAPLTRYSAYSSQIEKVDAPTGEAAMAPFAAELVRGVGAAVPLALYVDDQGRTSPPAGEAPRPVFHSRTAADRAARLAAIVIAWNVFQHFYPYFDVVKTDWPAELAKALRAAATDDGPEPFHKTLQRLVAALHDGHGNVMSPTMRGKGLTPFPIVFVEGQWVVAQSETEGVRAGDRIVSIDGKPVAQAEAELRETISAATEGWMRSKLAAGLRACNATGKMALELESFAAPRAVRKVEVECGTPKYKVPAAYPEPRLEKIADLDGGILYVDLDRVDDKDWKVAVERAGKAKAIVFDVRGYPQQPGLMALAHLTRETIRCARWNIPAAAKPDRLDFPFVESGWDVQPASPHFDIPRAFLTDGRAISYAETVMGMVEAYKLGEIVGETTAGTNGNVNPFRLPGGYSVTWTGMKVLKHDRSQHHAIGIRPTVPAPRTRAGVAAGRDEVLDKAVEVLKAKMR